MAQFKKIKSYPLGIKVFNPSVAHLEITTIGFEMKQDDDSWDRSLFNPRVDTLPRHWASHTLIAFVNTSEGVFAFDVSHGWVEDGILGIRFGIMKGQDKAIEQAYLDNEKLIKSKPMVEVGKELYS